MLGHSAEGNKHLVLSCSDGCLGLLDNDLLGLTLLALELESLTTLKLDLTWLHQLDLYMDTGPQYRSMLFHYSIRQ